MERKPNVGVGVIVIKDGKVLMGKRKNAHGEGSWCFPGGHLEFNEMVEECAQREVMEEAGIKIKNMKMGPVTNDIFEKEGKHYVTLFVIAEYESGYVQIMEPEKCERWGWFEWNRLPEPLFVPNQNLLKQGYNPFSSKIEIPKKPKMFVATKAFIVNNGKVLVVRESNKYEDGTNTGKYDVVGGRVEPGQHFQESLLREIEEEVGLKAEMKRPFYTNEWRPVVKDEPWQIVGTFFECLAEGEVKLSEDHDDYKWIDPKDYKEENLIENLWPAFEAYLNSSKII